MSELEQYRATPEDWIDTEYWAEHGCAQKCILELRARVEALEATQQPAAPAPNTANNLVRRVAIAIHDATDGYDWVAGSQAAIKEVAAWLREQQHGVAAITLERAVTPS